MGLSELSHCRSSAIPNVQVLMRADADDLIVEDGTVRGVRYHTDAGEQGEIRATLTVGADGRTSVTRAAAGLPLIETSPRDGCAVVSAFAPRRRA